MTDKRPIDANALYEDVSRIGLTNGSALGRHSGMADAIAQMIQDAPTIDPESLRGHELHADRADEHHAERDRRAHAVGPAAAVLHARSNDDTQRHDRQQHHQSRDDHVHHILKRPGIAAA